MKIPSYIDTVYKEKILTQDNDIRSLYIFANRQTNKYMLLLAIGDKTPEEAMNELAGVQKLFNNIDEALEFVKIIKAKIKYQK